MCSTSRGLDVSAVLDDRIERLARDLRAALDALAAIPQPLRSRLAGGLPNTILRTAEKVERDLAAPVREGRLHPADAWARLRAQRIRTDELLAECLSMVAGARVREPWQPASGALPVSGPLPVSGAQPACGAPPACGVGVCDVADALIDEMVARTPLAGWDSFTIAGTAQSFTRSSRVITVRFPDPTVWDLATTAHELGHCAARELSELRGGRMHNIADDLREELGCGTERWNWVEELFADAFAGWLLGPAYGLTCVSLVFDPLEADIDRDTHPCASARVRTIAAVLGASDDEDIRWFGGALTDLWGRLVVAGGAEPEAAGVERVDSWAARIVARLSDQLPYARYATLATAETIAADPRAAAVPEAATLADVVNAAWLARLRAGGGAGLHGLHEACTAVARRIIRGS